MPFYIRIGGISETFSRFGIHFANFENGKSWVETLVCSCKLSPIATRENHQHFF